MLKDKDADDIARPDRFEYSLPSRNCWRIFYFPVEGLLIKALRVRGKLDWPLRYESLSTLLILLIQC
ncbi:hypothetical protein L6452_42252 [Arctium lappa]|uniref:Uncharacterized protein n=1 Tax=Arctium lappa TaxID=4217 RepID=A0ACB8XIH9_ARCLA|nr:hypothetical protein L6452_42252 [Arctium lappa]